MESNYTLEIIPEFRCRICLENENEDITEAINDMLLELLGKNQNSKKLLALVQNH